MQEDGLIDLMAVTYATANLPLPAFIDKQWCADFIAKWFAIYPGAKSYFDGEAEKARRYGIVWTRTGRVRRIPETRSYHSYVQEAGVRQGNNHGIQGFNADAMRLGMGELGDRFQMLDREYGIPSYPLMTIYDEMLTEAEEDQACVIDAVQADVMDSVFLDRKSGRSLVQVPVKSDGGLLKRWTKD